MLRGIRQTIPALGVLAASGCADAPPPVDSVILITVDTWRADRFGAGGHPHVRTPHLDRFFRGGTQFTDAHAPIPTTLASHASLLSGEWPTGHGVPRNGWPVPPDVVTLAERLGDHGFASGAFVSSAALDPALGLDQGFDVYDFDTPRAEARDQDWRDATATLARAEQWWSRQSGRRFLWVHLFEPHFPYDPAPEDFALYDTGYAGTADGSMDFLFAMWADPALLTPEARDHLEALYHAEITGMDRAMGGALARWGAEEQVLLVLTADHGESVEDHGLRFKHGPNVYPPDVQVPLLFRGCAPFGTGLNSRVVRTIDVPGTILGRLGIRADLPVDAGNLAEPGSEENLAFAEASMPWNVEEEGTYANYYKQRVVRTRDWTYLETPYLNERVWFDRRRDPDETRPVPAPSGPEGERLPAALKQWIDRGENRPAPTTVDPALMEQLRALGYTGE